MLLTRNAMLRPSVSAFVIMGFPISMYGIFGHLSHYYQPNVQCYVVRILWMVPIYSIESWLCLRFHESALYIETLRDCYESYVIYCFFKFLIAVLGGEDRLILMLKDKVGLFLYFFFVFASCGASSCFLTIPAPALLA